VTTARRPRPRRWPGPGTGRPGGSSTVGAAGAAWALWALALVGLATVPWFDHLTRRAGRPDLVQLNASTIPYLLAIVVAATVGAVLAGRLPRHPVAGCSWPWGSR
jgi:hypothetical protein